jgi:hypothetical protein
MKTALKQEEKPAMREHWSTAPELVKARIADSLRRANAGQIGPQVPVHLCFECGYDLRLDEVPQPLTKALEGVTDSVRRSEITRQMGSMLEFGEVQALQIWHRHAEWRTRTLASEQASKISAVDAEQREARIRARAAEILDERRRTEELDAYKQAEKELFNV